MRILLLSLLLTGCTFAPITIRVLPEPKPLNHCIKDKRIVCEYSTT